MRILFFAALLFVFSVGSFASSVSAATEMHACMHHDAADDTQGGEHCPPDHEHESGQCDDCCCSHVHTMVELSTPKDTLFSLGAKSAPLHSDHYHSRDTDSLYRPPRS
ncbi:MAG: hypothetical protein ACRBDL_01240 [Alphaproteobacteria bacterium]